MDNNVYMKIFLTFLLAVILSGCQSLQEPFKTVWGSSTRALEEARVDSLSKYYECEFDDCFNEILSLKRKEPSYKPQAYHDDHPVVSKNSSEEESSTDAFTLNNNSQKDNSFDVFSMDKIRGFIVVMGLDGYQDTTEVGVFLSRYNRNCFKVEVASLSEIKKRRVAEIIFKKLSEKFKEIQ